MSERKKARPKRLIFWVSSALLFAACRSVTPGSYAGAPAKDTEDRVRQMASAIAHDVSRDGPNAWLRYFADDRGFFMANNGELQFSSFGEARSFLAKFSAGVAHLDLSWGDIRVDPVAPGAAVMAARYREVLTDVKGHVVHFEGYFTGLAVETNSGWKLRDAHWSTSIPSP